MLNKLVAVELGDFDVITVSETWPDQSITNSNITIPGTRSLSVLTETDMGGGALQSISNKMFHL